MFDLEDPRNRVPSALTDYKTCITCGRDLAMNCFQRDSSYRDGRRDQCEECQRAPRLATTEHIARLRENNFRGQGTKRQRWEDQDDFRDDKARWGNSMSSSDFIAKIQCLTPNLYITEGNIEGDLAIFRTFGKPQPHLNGRTFEYLFYITKGRMPEFSIIEFDILRDVPIKEKLRGWRTALLRLIKAGVITEEQSNEVFGTPTGVASNQWFKQLYIHRNGTK